MASNLFVIFWFSIGFITGFIFAFKYYEKAITRYFGVDENEVKKA